MPSQYKRPQSSSLLDLPPELRLQIYSQIDAEARPHMQITHSGAVSLWPSNLCIALAALSRSCKLLHTEVQDMLYSTPHPFEIRGDQWRGCVPYGSRRLDECLEFLLRMRYLRVRFRFIADDDCDSEVMRMLLKQMSKVLTKLDESKLLERAWIEVHFNDSVPERLDMIMLIASGLFSKLEQPEGEARFYFRLLANGRQVKLSGTD